MERQRRRHQTFVAPESFVFGELAVGDDGFRGDGGVIGVRGRLGLFTERFLAEKRGRRGEELRRAQRPSLRTLLLGMSDDANTHVDDPRVLKRLLDGVALGRVDDHEVADQVLGFRGDGLPEGRIEGDVGSEDLLRERVGVEGQSAGEDDVEKNTE